MGVEGSEWVGKGRGPGRFGLEFAKTVLDWNSPKFGEFPSITVRTVSEVDLAPSGGPENGHSNVGYSATPVHLEIFLNLNFYRLRALN